MTEQRTNPPPCAESSRRLTVAELAATVALALSHDYDGTGSGRIRDVPGVRVIRWYQTIGLVDRPAEMRGRTALYTSRHVRQIVAVKRLQAEGRSIAEIQQKLLGATDEELTAIARVPEAVLAKDVLAGEEAAGTDAGAVTVSASLPSSAPRGRFWADRGAATGRSAGVGEADDPRSVAHGSAADTSALASDTSGAAAPVASPAAHFAAAAPASAPVEAPSPSAAAYGSAVDAPAPASAEVSQLPVAADRPPGDGAPPASPAVRPGAPSFATADLLAHDVAVSYGPGRSDAATSPSRHQHAAAAVPVSYALALTDAVTVIVDLPQPPTAADLAAIRAAAEPLLAEVAARRHHTTSADPAGPATAARGLTEGATA